MIIKGLSSTVEKMREAGSFRKLIDVYHAGVCGWEEVSCQTVQLQREGAKSGG